MPALWSRLARTFVSPRLLQKACDADVSDGSIHKMNDQSGATETPWWRRNKEQRRAVYEQAEAKRKATLKRRLDHIDQKYNNTPRQDTPSADTPTQQAAPDQYPGGSQAPTSGMAGVPAGWEQTPQGDRAVNRAARFANLSLWVTLAPAVIGVALFVILAIVILAILL